MLSGLQGHAIEKGARLGTRAGRTLLLGCVLLYAENVVEVGGHTSSGSRAEWASEEHEGTGWESARANVFAGFI
jgi:hypothetical protein